MKAIAALVTIALVACAPQSSGPSPATAAPVPRTLTVIQATELDSMDPHVTTKGAVQSLLINIFEGLVARDPKTMQWQPGLATSWSTPDPTTWIFKIRTGVTFHNGEKLDAEAVKSNLDRVVKPELKSAIGLVLAPVFAKVEAVDPTTLRITTKTPAPWLPERLSRFWMMAPKETAEKGHDWVATHPVGTGPYKFVEWKTGASVTMERFDGYWGPKPAFQEVVFRQILESATRMSELLAGTADIIEQTPTDQISVVETSGKAVVVSATTTTMQEIGIDALGRSGPNPWTDVRVRQAANHAVDREGIAKALYGGHAKPATSFLNPIIFGYDASIRGYAYDPAKARQLLAEAGYANGFDTNMTVFPQGQVSATDLAQAILSDLAKVGIRGKISQITANEASPLINSGRIGPIWLRPNSCGNSFDAHLCFSFLTKGATNANWSSDRLEELRLKAGSSNDPAERLRLYSQAQQHVLEQAPVIFGWTGYYLSSVSKKVDWAPLPDSMTRAYLAKPK